MAGTVHCLTNGDAGRRVLESFYIGELRPSAGSTETVQYKNDAAKGKFYDVLRRRVEKFFRGNKVCHCCQSRSRSDADGRAPSSYELISPSTMHTSLGSWHAPQRYTRDLDWE